MILAGIRVDYQTDLRFIEGSLTGLKYQDDILHPMFRPIEGDMGKILSSWAIMLDLREPESLMSTWKVNEYSVSNSQVFLQTLHNWTCWGHSSATQFSSSKTDPESTRASDCVGVYGQRLELLLPCTEVIQNTDNNCITMN